MAGAANQNTARADLICLGEPMIEFNQQDDGRFAQGFGGDVSNCAIAAARQGAKVRIATRLGADLFGDLIAALWDREGVDHSATARDPDAPTGVYFVTHGETGHAFSYLRAGSAASRIRPDDLASELIRTSTILHVSGISQGISPSAADTVFAAIDMAREAGARVSYDTNLRLKLWPLERARAVIHAAMARCDIALPGLDDAEALTGLSDPDKIADYYLALGAKVVALTLGAAGALVATPSERRRVAGKSVAAVDATGAGDAFDGAFLAELASGRSPFEAARYANACAALSTQGFGAVAPLPTRAAVERFLTA